MADQKLTDAMKKQAQRASGLGFCNQFMAGPPVDDKPMTVERASGLLKRAYGYFSAKEQRVAKVYNALAKA